MIIRKHKWISLIFSVKMSIIHVIWLRLTILFIFSSILTIIYFEFNSFHFLGNFELPTVDFLPASFIGFVIALYLGFANSSAYERWWEARKLWGALVNTARSFARQVVVLINDNEISDPVLKQVNVIEAIQKDIVKSIIAFVYLFKNNLRHTNDNKHELELYLSFEEINYLINQFNKPNAMLVLIERKLTNSFKKGYINNFYYNLLSTQLVELTNIMGGCERINSTPIPFPYKVLVNRLVLIFCYALPFSLVKTEGIFAPFVILLMSYALFGLAALIDELEMPFGYETNDLPLEAISRMIEINLLQVIGEVDLPNFKTPNKDGILL